MTLAELARFNAKTKFERRIPRRRGVRGPCLVWTGAKNSAGYAVLRLDGKGRLVLAHRLAYEHFVGPMPAGHEPDHLCSQTDCVNHEHLEAVTHRENLRRAHARRPWNLVAA